MVHGGIAPNVIADKAHFYWDLRTIPADCVDTIMNEFEAHCRQRKIYRLFFLIFPSKLLKIISVPHLDTKADADVETYPENLGKSKLNTVSYASEGQFANEGFQSAICGPGDIAQAHRPNEFMKGDCN